MPQIDIYIFITLFLAFWITTFFLYWILTNLFTPTIFKILFLRKSMLKYLSKEIISKTLKSFEIKKMLFNFSKFSIFLKCRNFSCIPFIIIAPIEDLVEITDELVEWIIDLITKDKPVILGGVLVGIFLTMLIQEPKLPEIFCTIPDYVIDNVLKGLYAASLGVVIGYGTCLIYLKFFPKKKPGGDSGKPDKPDNDENTEEDDSNKEKKKTPEKNDN